MSFNNSLCAKCFGCNLLELPNFTGVNCCSNAIIVQVETEQAKMQTRGTYDAINKIHEILGVKQVATGEQLSINNMQN